MYRFLPFNFIQIPTYADSYKFLHFGVEITTSKKNPVSHIIQNHWKTQLYYELFSFNLTVKYIQLYNFCLWNCPWTHNAYRLAVRKAFLFQMLGDTYIFTLPGKVSLWQKFQNDVLFGNMNMDVSPYILKFKFFFKILVLQWLFGFMLVSYSQKVKWHTFPNRIIYSFFIETQHIL